MGAINAVHKHRVRHHERMRVPKGRNLGFSLWRRLFWYAEPVRARSLPLVGEKYIKANKQINTNLKVYDDFAFCKKG